MAVGIFIYSSPGAAPGDVDNYAKAILDGLEGVAYKNDHQVQALVVEKLPEGPNGPRVDVLICPYESNAVKEIVTAL